MTGLSFRDRLMEPGVLILDGALGTELERRGIPTPEPFWSAEALLSDDGRSAIRDIHEAYLRSGADIITANTFRSNLRASEKRGIGDRAEAITTMAVELAVEARNRVGDGAAWVAGSISPVEDCFSPWLVPDEDALRREHTLAATWLANAGADLILVETMNRIDEARIATEAAVATGLPVMTSFVCTSEGTLLSGQSVSDAVAAIVPFGPVALLVNCIPTPVLGVALEVLARSTTLPIGAYGNMGPPVAATTWTLDEAVGPDRYALYATEWLATGATIIGGCCGTTPAHVTALRASVVAPS